MREKHYFKLHDYIIHYLHIVINVIGNRCTKGEEREGVSKREKVLREKVAGS